MLDNEPVTGSGSSEQAGPAADGETKRTRRRTTTAVPTDTGTPGDAPPAKKATRARKSAPAAATFNAETAETSAEGASPTPAKATKRTRRTTKATSPAVEPQDAAPDGESGAAGAQASAGDDAAPAETGRRSRTRKIAAAFSAVEASAVEPPEAPAEPESGGRRRPAPVTALFVAPTAVESALAAAAAPPAAGSGVAGSGSAGSGAAGSGAAGSAASGSAATTERGAGEADEAPSRSRRRNRRAVAEPVEDAAEEAGDEATALDDEDDDEDENARRRRRRGRRGRGRGKGPHDDDTSADGEEDSADSDDDSDDEDAEAGEGMTRRRRRRRRRGAGGGDEGESEAGVVTVVKIREPRSSSRDEVQGVSGSTRLEAKRQRRRDGRDQRRTRPSILSESEFLARREAVNRVMAIRQKGDRTQIAVLEDGVLVEHYVSRNTTGSLVGNVYLGKVQNVLPSMEAAFVDIGRGRNAVLYAGEVNWDMAGLEGRARSIEQALKSGDSVLVQVTKDPIGHKGARLTSHIALSGRHLVYVPNGTASGISRKLSDVERKRLRDILKKLVPEGAGVIVRTAAEGASEDELERDVTRLAAQWDDIQAKAASGGAPVQLYEEPDLVIRVVRDLFNEDFRELILQGSDVYETVEAYLNHVSPDLVARLKRHTGTADLFAVHRIDEQIMKGLDRKVYLPSGGSLVIDRTEAMTVIDVNTGKYTGTGGNLEETVTRNNLEAAEEIVRQLRLRDLGGIIVIDFIDMVLESNRELVLRRLTECLGRDRTKHQVTEITSLGLVQMTRKRIGQGLLEAFSETCEHCKGRGVILHMEPVPEKKGSPALVAAAMETAAAQSAAEPAEAASSGGRRRGRRGRGGSAAAVADPIDDALFDVPPTTEAPISTDAPTSTDTRADADAPTSTDVQEADAMAGTGAPAGTGVAPESETTGPVADAERSLDAPPVDAAADEPASAVVPGATGVVRTATVTTSWTPPVTKSWVNLGAAPPRNADAPEAAVDPAAAGGAADPDVMGGAAEAGGAGGAADSQPVGGADESDVMGGAAEPGGAGGAAGSRAVGGADESDAVGGVAEPEVIGGVAEDTVASREPSPAEAAPEPVVDAAADASGAEAAAPAVPDGTDPGTAVADAGGPETAETSGTSEVAATVEQEPSNAGDGSPEDANGYRDTLWADGGEHAGSGHSGGAGESRWRVSRWLQRP